MEKYHLSRALDVDAPALPPAPWFVVGRLKLASMSVLTLGVYELYWFYKHWQLEKNRTGEDISPGARALFSGIFCFSLFERVSRSAEAIGHRLPAPTLLAITYFMLSLAYRLPDPYWLVAFLNVLPLLVVQRAATAVTLRNDRGVDHNTRLKGWNWLVIFVGLPFFLLAALGSLFPHAFEPPEPTSEAYLADVATELNKKLPKALDDQTEWTTTTGLEGRLVYDYLLTRSSVAELDLEAVRKEWKQRLVESNCSGSTKEEFLDKGVSLVHVYRDKDRQHVASITIALSDCRAPRSTR